MRSQWRRRVGIASMLVGTGAGLLASGCSSVGSLPGTPSPTGALASFASVAERVAPSTAAVYCAHVMVDPGGETDSPNIGSGFVVDASGVVATAAHVIEGCEEIVVRGSDGRIERAEAMGVDTATDVALLRVPAGFGTVPVFGNSTTMRPGDWALAIGEPYGLGRSVSLGVIGSLERHFPQDDELLFIQSDVAVNPGNSGGPLLDAQGRIIGMNVRVLAGPLGMAGISLSIPVEQVLEATRRLLAGESPPPSFGASFEDVPPLETIGPGGRRVRGARVLEVEPGSTAERIGVRAKDLIVAFDGKPVTNSVDLSRLLAAWKREVTPRVAVERGGRVVEFPATAPTTPPSHSAQKGSSAMGSSATRAGS